jgi:methylmalonyl-CoA mutase N-terminal domain/subunit
MPLTQASPYSRMMVETLEKRSNFAPSSGHPVKRVYLPSDCRALRYGNDLGKPGRGPYTRGIHSAMYRERLWTIRQYTGFGSARETNRRFKLLIKQTGPSVAFDLPTQLGYDSDNPKVEGEIGRVGVPIYSVSDMQTLFQGTDLANFISGPLYEKARRIC